MNKLLLSVAAMLAIGIGSAAAADLPAKVYTKAPAPAPFDPWDVAFGSSIASDYIFRGITQSNHEASVSAYFEPRYNVNKDLQLYVGTSSESISFPNRASAEVDIYGGVRPTFGAAAFDFGLFGYLYPGGTCYNANAFPGSGVPGSSANCVANADPLTGGLPINGNFAKRDASFFEAYGKLNYTFNDYFALGGNVFYSPNFLNLGTDGTYASVVGKVTAPTSIFGTTGIGAFVSGEYGRQWLGTSDRFYGTFIAGSPFQNGIKEPSYDTWNIGVGFTYKVFTLDLRYSDTDLSKQQCNAFTSDYTASTQGAINPNSINPGGFQSNWCGSRFTAKLSADLTAMTNLK